MTAEPSHPLLQANLLSRNSPTDGRKLLCGVSLVIQTGDQIVLHGESGAGKTVLLRALAALDSTEGDIKFGGARIVPSDIPAFRAKICYLHQTALLPEGTVREALQEPFSWAAHAERQYSEKQASTWLRFLGRSNDFLEKSTVNLSGGEAQIVAVVRALILSPDVLLLDEPTSALDGKTAKKLEQMLLKWVSDGKRAFVWATHDEAQALRVGSRTIEMADGAISNA